uniref:RUN domain-containing protein n=1 Tax=Nothobranchius furzeri TaxID=105023 RepID=A0A8C6PNH5_NOTFU
MCPCTALPVCCVLTVDSCFSSSALIGAVGAAVEAILAQFSSSRTIVQKALSGDSAVNPSLGRLVLQCLCPALHNLLTDGLKPHQSDLIAGRRPNSAWGLVQATARPVKFCFFSSFFLIFQTFLI